MNSTFRGFMVKILAKYPIAMPVCIISCEGCHNLAILLLIFNGRGS